MIYVLPIVVLYAASAVFGADLCDRAIRLLRTIEKRGAFDFEKTPRSILAKFFAAIFFYTVATPTATFFWIIASVFRPTGPFSSRHLGRRCVVSMIALGAARAQARRACCEEHADTYLLAIDDALNAWVSSYGKDAMGYEAFTAEVNKFLRR